MSISWPTPQEFNEAVQNPRLNLADQELKGGRAELSPLGLPIPITGAFASVYKLNCENRTWAVRCFLHEIRDQEERYRRISEFVLNDDLVYTVSFDYQKEGIRVRNDWFPILKMEWVEGVPLEQFVAQHVTDELLIERLDTRFHEMMQELADNGIAHGDLQHGNMIIVGSDFRLVDYDGMYVPTMEGWQSNELGHPNYQHPRRHCKHFGPYLDNFAAWAVHVSLLCIKEDPTLWESVSGGDDCLLFRRTDFRNPRSSLTFLKLLEHSSSTVRQAAELLQRLTEYPLKQVPPLNQGIKSVKDLPPIDDTLVEPEEPGDEVTLEEMRRLQVSSTVSQKKIPRLVHFEEPLKLEVMSEFPEWMEDLSQPEAGRQIARVSDPWPGHMQYLRSAMQKNFDDPELRYGVVTDYFIGSTAIVLQIHCLTRKLAIKCYYKHDPSREEHYQKLAHHIKGQAAQYFVPFEYKPAGIRVGPLWYPILKMEFASGMPFKGLAKMKELRSKGYYWLNPQSIFKLRANLRSMMKDLAGAQIVHGDFNPHNIFVINDRFKLLDYDSMWVPTMDNLPTQDPGDPAYQHQERYLDIVQGSYATVPPRRGISYRPDNFSSWIVDLELLLLGVDLGTWTQVETWGYQRASYSAHKEVRAHSKKLSEFARMNPSKVPPLEPYNLPVPGKA